MTKRILVVEDQEDNRQIIRDLLDHAGFEVIEVGDGEKALTAVAEHRPDVILMDVQLPLLDGYEATRRIKADPVSLWSHRMHWVATRPRRAPPVAMPTWQSLTARRHCSPKFVNMHIDLRSRRPCTIHRGPIFASRARMSRALPTAFPGW